MRWWDVEAVAALEASLFGPTAWSVELFWSELAAPGRCYLVAESADGAGPARAEQPAAQLLGYAGLAVGGVDADVQTLAVSPSAQRQGLGRTLLTALTDRARAAGATTLMLEVAADNEPARALYASAGFTRIGVRRGYYQPTGTDALVLRARLL